MRQMRGGGEPLRWIAEKPQAEGFTISHLGVKKILGGNQPVKVAENSKRRVNGPLVR